MNSADQWRDYNNRRLALSPHDEFKWERIVAKQYTPEQLQLAAAGLVPVETITVDAFRRDYPTQKQQYDHAVQMRYLRDHLKGQTP